MKNRQERKKRLNWMSHHRILPFDLDFLREIGFDFGLDWDGQLIITTPEEVPIDSLINLIKQFEEGIKTRLYFEGKKAKSIFVGGPLNGESCFGRGMPKGPIYHHVKRAEWLVYMVKNYDDPRAWFVGKASSKKKAKILKLR